MRPAAAKRSGPTPSAHVVSSLALPALPPSCHAADKYLEYYMHYETYVSSAGHLDFQVGGWAVWAWAVGGCVG
jgi:hypothetical protein